MAAQILLLDTCRHLRRHFAVLAVCAATALSMAVRAAAGESRTIAIVLTPHKSYRAAAALIKSELARAGRTCVIIELPQSAPADTQPAPTKPTDTKPTPEPPSPTEKALAKLAETKPAVIVTAGARATTLALETVPDTPVVFCMVPNALDLPAMQVGNTTRKRLAGVTTDISPREYTNWIQKLHPHIRNIGVLYSDHGKHTVEAITSEAKKQEIRILPIKAHREEFPNAIEILVSQGCDAVLMIPDAHVYNSANVQRLLLWGLRQKKPVWAFSANIVKAGAFVGLYSDDEDIGRQTAQIVQKIMAGTRVSTIKLQYPQVIRSAINERTADMIGISLSSSVLNSISVRYGKQE